MSFIVFDIFEYTMPGRFKNLDLPFGVVRTSFEE